MFPPDCTLTTACFDLTSFNPNGRNLNDSINNMKALLEIPCYLIIYADNNCMDLIKKIRNSYGLENITYYVQMEFNELPKYKYLETIKKNREIYWPTRDIRTSSESHLVTLCKADFVLESIEKNPFNTTKFGWIDSNLGSENLSKICQNYENNMLLYILNNITDKFHIQILNVCDKKYKESNNKREYYSRYQWVVCGSLFTMSKEIGLKILLRLNEIAIKTTELGYGHAEEMFFLEILDEFYDDIERSYGDYYNILNNFIRPTLGFEYIYYKIIKNYKDKGYNKECYDCCKKVLNEIETYKVKINYEIYFSILFYYYLCTYYYKGKDEAKNIVNHIMELIRINPYIKKEYDKNSDFYKTNFNYVL